MWLPLLIATTSVVAGSLLALGTIRRGYILGPIQTFAFVATGTVVFAKLLPDSLSSIGAWSLLIFVSSFALPALLERQAKTNATRKRSQQNVEAEHHHDDPHLVGVELGYAGLVAHQFLEGCGLGIYGGVDGNRTLHIDVMLALSAHIIPVTALFILTIARLKGRKTAFVRALILILVTSLGVLAASSAEHTDIVSVIPWISATMSGFLLHVVLHDWQGPTTRSGTYRALDFIAILAGLALVFLFGKESHHHGAEEDITGHLSDAFWALSFETAPTLLLGLVAAALLQSFGVRLPDRWLRSKSRVRDALRGATLGAPLPVCSCGVLPITEGLRQRRASIAFVVAFLIATPELGIETVALTARLMGWPFAMVRLFAAIAVAVGVAVVVGIAQKGSEKQEELIKHKDSPNRSPATREKALRMQAQEESTRRERSSLASRTLHHFDDLLVGIGPLVLLGIITASYIEVLLPTRAFDVFGGSGLDVIVLSLLAMPSYVCATSSTPIVVVLLAKGVSPGAALAVLLLGPATNIATVGFLRRAYGGRATLAILLCLFGFTWILCYALNAWTYYDSAFLGDSLSKIPSASLPLQDGTHAHVSNYGILSYLGVGALLLLVARNLWAYGLRPWIHTLGSIMGGHSHVHTVEADTTHNCCKS